MSFALLLGLASLVIALLVGGPRWRAWRRAAWAARPFPAAWRLILRRRVPFYLRLTAPQQLQLRRLIQVFLAEKPFIGCRGLVVTDEVRVTIAALACLLQLNRPGPLFPELREVLVYPDAFVVQRVVAEPGGVLSEQRQALSGQSWARGQVVLSWADVLEGARVPDDGRNVVLHEFAHQLDSETGTTNGAPWLPGAAARAQWAQVMSAEFAALRARLAAGQDGLIPAYGASEPAEFFAVATEVFFEQAGALAAQHPALYAVLRDFYGSDPREWTLPGA